MVGATEGTGFPNAMTRWLVTGAGGVLGNELLTVLRGPDVVALTRSGLDITDASMTRHTVRDHRSDVVVNTAAWSAVDLAMSARRQCRNGMCRHW
jgi:dTDP-4-dehydrorhamnose reductase